MKRQKEAAPIHPAAVFTPQSKLAELIEANYRLLFVFRRMGIPLGFGETTVGQMCRRKNLSVELFLAICRIHSGAPGPLSPDMSADFPLEELIDYLHNSHQYYAQKIPLLRAKIHDMVALCEPEQLRLLERFVDDYRRETENHFDYEEQTVFPYIRALAQGRGGQGYHIEQFEENHSNIEEKLHDLRNIILKYLPESCSADLRDDILFELFLLEDDLGKHTLIENRILIPCVAKLEADENR